MLSNTMIRKVVNEIRFLHLFFFSGTKIRFPTLAALQGGGNDITASFFRNST